MTLADTVTDVDAFARDWENWHETLEEGRRAPHGFLAYAGFHVLGAEPRRFDGVPGAWSTGEGGPVVELADGETLVIGGTPVTGRHEYGVIGERTFHSADHVTPEHGHVVVELSRRGGQDIVRPLRPDHVLRVGYRGTPAYAPDPRWVIEAVFEREQPRDIPISAAIPEITHTHSTPGRVRFTVDGASYALTLISRGPRVATLLFRDATSGVTTYAASRTLAVPLPDDSSDRVVLDFNRATNLQCAYTDYSPCPLAPPENHLPFAVEAGEKIPLDRTS
ncbi:DUF1684 domain-containing protein [Microbacterium sp. No. 7]|uniref:DUF1684 domain-containing protein n=1 Tax=Microbacterium sp. No. 7 TaxID=1714373 RepID=UPI0006D23E07|nr:DUF1684 domain-containing protein [Microbacterium sp. No. 7]ALJ18553.1 hypothetical protein AOA12_00930 [Microbacterium sp. No. 7]